MTAGGRAGALAVVVLGLVSTGVASQPSSSAPPGPAFLVRPFDGSADRRESGPDILDTPVLPGSVIKAVTLIAALEHHVIEPDTSRICRQTVTVGGRTYVCSHPDLRRPLTAAEALAHSCNDFFVSLAPRLSREAFNQTRASVGLPPVGVSADLAASFVGLDGPRITPRALLDVMARLIGASPDHPTSLPASFRRVLLDGMSGAAQYGSASALGLRGIDALAKTGTAPMPGGSFMGVLVAFAPASKPTRGIVVVAPGAAGLDAASLAVDLLKPTIKPLFVRLGTTSPDGRTRVGRVELEDYVAQVLAGEGQPSAGDAAQQALAIAARTFALANRNRHRREGFDLCDTTHCQVVRASTVTTRRAAEATSGRILLHQGQPATIFYSANCGGRSELASAVWPGAVDYATVVQDDDACAGEPGWTSEIRADQIERALRAEGLRGDRLRGLTVVERTSSGRVARLRVDGFSPPEVSGHDFRMAIGRTAGWQLLKSTAFDVERTGTGYQFRGRGFGHGVGLCVIGAGRRAAASSTAEEILRFYYPSLAIGTFHDDSRAATAAAPATTPRPTPPPANRPADVLLALPSGEDAERARIIDMVRRARSEVSAKAGLSPPSSIRVTVHSTVEAFARATGQPWWVSGATDGTSIDLLPLAVLQQQGQLERTLRHEVAHVVLDSALAGRPLWVREGAAFYFAEPGAPPAAASGRVACPHDDEFLRPLSAGAHRSAYARAESCFRRAISDGRQWTDVR